MHPHRILVAAVLLALAGIGEASGDRIEVSLARRIFGPDCPVRVVGKSLSVELRAVEGEPARHAGSVEDGGESLPVSMNYAGPDATLELRVGDEVFEIEPTYSETPSNLGMDRIATWRADRTLRLSGGTYRPVLRISTRFQTGAPPLRLESESALVLHGSLNLAGTRHDVVVADIGGDGVFGNEADRWRVIPADVLKELNTGEAHLFGSFSLYGMEDPVHLAGDVVLRIDEIGDGVARLRITHEDGTLQEYMTARAAASDEGWERQFADSLRSLVERYRDPSRSAAEPPPAWKFANSPDQLANLARDSDKPVFALFATEWCMWCAVLRSVTLRDSEVATLLEQFELVRVDAELFLGDPLKRYGLRGYPSVAVLNEEGEIAARIEGFLPPGKYARKIRSAADAAKE